MKRMMAEWERLVQTDTKAVTNERYQLGGHFSLNKKKGEKNVCFYVEYQLMCIPSIL